MKIDNFVYVTITLLLFGGLLALIGVEREIASVAKANGMHLNGPI